MLGSLSGAQAKNFNSTLRLKVYERGTGEVPDRILGFTPLKPGKHIRVPEDRIWYVQPIGALSGIKLQKLAEEIRKNNISGLDLSDHWELSNASLPHLEHLPSLRLLDISRTKISDEGLSSVRTLKQLKILSLPEGVGDVGLARLRPLSQLRELSLDRTHITQEGLRLLVAFPYLRNLDLSGTMIDDEGLHHLPLLRHLRRLVLNGLITDKGVVTVAHFRSLEEVEISQTQIGDEGIRFLAMLPKLKTLYANKKIGDEGLHYLKGHPTLRSLDLTGAGVTDAGMESLSQIAGLEELALSDTQVGNKGMTALARLTKLHVLELSETRVTSEGLAPLAAAKHLDVLSLSWQTLSRADLEGMAKLTQLKTIILGGVPLPESTMAQLRGLNRVSPWEPVRGVQPRLVKPSVPSASRDMLALATPVSVQKPSIPEAPLLPEAPRSHRGLKTLESDIAASVQTSGGPSKAMVEPKSGSKVQWSGKAPKKDPAVGDLALLSNKPEPMAVPNPRTRRGSVLEVAPLSSRARSSTLEATPIAVSSTSLENSHSKSAPDSATRAAEDNLLKVIALKMRQSKGGFSGLSGMRQVRLADNPGALADIESGEKSAIDMEEDKPENSLGELTVNATPSNKKSKKKH